MAAKAEPTRKVKAMVRLVSIPIISAASMSCEVARMALPIRVLLMR
jgi:IMP dehydrogenase/GMP reductase